MLQVARLSPKLLGDSADLVREYVRSQLTPAGGFADRAGNPDLYYTVFGLEGLFALRADLPVAQVLGYLKSQGVGEHLDFVHLSCLCRCWAGMPKDEHRHIPADAILAKVESFRSADGGYAQEPGEADGTIYGCFLALGAYQDLGRDLPDVSGVLHCVNRLRAEDGGYANQLDVPLGLTPSTAAAVTLLRQYHAPIPEGTGEWLLSRHAADGGFFATPIAPMPDLLSTATALHALAGLHVNLDPIREPCLDFIDTLWTSQGGFHGTWADDTLDVEYTYYGLLALGHLSV
jgi:prenyltransferase beta subunit